MTADLEDKPHYTVDFRAPSYLPDVWFSTHTTADQAEAERELAALVDADIRAGAPIGCEWRATFHPTSSAARIVRRIVLTVSGPQDQSA